MANSEHLTILKRGVKDWNKWRDDYPGLQPDLSGADLSDANLRGANFKRANLYWAYLTWANLSEADLGEANLRGTKLSGADLSAAILSNADLSRANLSGANLSRARLIKANLSGTILNRANLSWAHLSETDLSKTNLTEANLSGAILTGANLSGTDLAGADLSGTDLNGAHFSNANLREIDLNAAILNNSNLSGANLIKAKLRRAHLSGADLSGANLSGANLYGADLSRTILIETNLEQADISGCRIFGVSAWKMNVQNLKQANLIITELGEPEITVDNIEVAQFVYLLLHNEKIRDVISTIGQKAVLILGRFALPERKAILEAMRNKLREKGYLPIVFDFEKSDERDFTETIQVLAGMCLFVIADITNPKSSPLELQATVPNYMIPFAPIIQAGENPFAMFVDLQHKYQWMMKVRTYKDETDLIENFEKGIINPALKRHNKLLILKNKDLEILSIGDDDEEE